LIIALLALPFIPEEDVAETFKSLVAHAPPELNEFIDFYGRTYIGLIKQENSWIIVTPRFSEYNTVFS